MFIPPSVSIRSGTCSAGLLRMPAAWLATFLSILLLAAACGAAPVFPEPSQVAMESVSRARTLTREVAGLAEHYRHAGALDRPGLQSRLAAVVAERRALMRALIESSPAEALALTLTEEQRVGLPEAIAVQLERKVDLVGNLVVLYEDFPLKARLKPFLETPDAGRMALHFTGPMPGWPTGTQVRAHGIALDHSVALRPDDIVLTLAARGGKTGGSNGGTPATPMPSTGAHRTLVVLVTFQDAPVEPYTPEYAREQLALTDAWFRENAGGKMWLETDVVGWYVIPLNAGACDTTTIEALARDAAMAAGYDPDAYQHLVFAFPQDHCGWWGLSSVGGVPSRTWITGELELRVTAHELGHGLGLFHSHARECGDTTLGTACTRLEYGDMLGMMGSSYGAHFNVFQKERLGWLGGDGMPGLTEVTQDGTYVIDAYTGDGIGPRGLKVLRSTDPDTGARTWYYVAYRQAVGFDTELAGYPNVLGGLSILAGDDQDGNTSERLDMTPGSGATPPDEWSDPALVFGQRFDDPGMEVSILADTALNGQAVVTVRYGDAPGQALSATVATRWPVYDPGQRVELETPVTVDGVPASGATVSFAVTKPTGETLNATATTGLDGVARYDFILRRREPAGAWSVAVVAGRHGLVAESGMTFEVR